MDQEKLQQNYMMFQKLQEQMKQLQENTEQINNKIEEVRKVISDVSEISALEKGTEILVPVSNGIFITAKTEDTKNFKVNVGAKTVVTKDKEGVKKLLLTQKDELLQVQLQLSKDQVEVEAQAMRIQEEMKKLVGQ